MDYFPESRLTPFTKPLYKTPAQHETENQQIKQEMTFEKKLRADFRVQMLPLIEKYRTEFQRSEDAFIFAQELLRSINDRYPACNKTTPIIAFVFTQIVTYCKETLDLSEKICYYQTNKLKPSSTLISFVNKFYFDVLQRLDEDCSLSNILFESLTDQKLPHTCKWEDIYVYYGIMNRRWAMERGEKINDLAKGKKEYVLNYLIGPFRAIKFWVKGLLAPASGVVSAATTSPISMKLNM